MSTAALTLFVLAGALLILLALALWSASHTARSTGRTRSVSLWPLLLAVALTIAGVIVR